MRGISVRDAHRRLGISERTIRRWIKDGDLQAHTVGGITQVHPEQVEILVEKSKLDRHKRPARPLINRLGQDD